MIELIHDFVAMFGTSIKLNEYFIAKQNDRYFLLNEKTQPLTLRNFYYAGTYLGKTESGRFSPSFDLLNMIALKKANKIILGKKAEWLYICGRDVFAEGIIKTTGSTKRGDYALILNKRNECLGFGKILRDLDATAKGLTVKNILDIGDFLRREKGKIEKRTSSKR